MLATSSEKCQHNVDNFLRTTGVWQKMALVLLLMMVAFTSASNTSGEMALANVTRFANGDLFSLIGTDCGLTRCMEMSHGTALAALGGGGGCVCQCRRETPTFREDRRTCVNSIDECPMASFGRGATKPQIPFVFLPLKGQIIYPSKEIIFTDVEDAICAVTSAQYLSPSGWVTLRDLADNDVPFGLYRDEGSTYLQWRGSPSLHTRLEGRLVTAHVLCSAPKPAHLAASCAAFRIAGITRNVLLDVRSIPFHAGETVTTEPAAQSQGLSVLESLAIGVCVLMIVFVYAAGIIFYIHYKQKQRRKMKDPELNISQANSTDNLSILDARMNMDSMRMKTNPLMTLESTRSDYTNDAGLSDVSEHTEDTFDSSSVNTQKDPSSNVVAALVHSRCKKPSRPSVRATSTPERANERLQRRSASPEIEKAPHSDLSILHCSIDNNISENTPPPPVGEPVIRRKLYFNPVFFEVEHLKSPPPAAIDFLIKLREVMSIAKEKMISKRFIPILSDIPEEESYHTVDLGWDIPCARRGRRFSAISLKRENSRRAIICGGCPGCNSKDRTQKNTSLIRSNSCNTCVSENYKQKIVQKWLDEVPTPSNVTKPVKSVAKVSGTPRITEPKEKEEIRINLVEPLRNEDLDTARIAESILTKYVINDINTKNKDNNIEDYKMKNLKTPENNIILSSANSLERKPPSSYGTRYVRKKLPPPPPPPTNVGDLSETKDAEYVSPEVKRRMEAVIRELNKCHHVDSDEFYEVENSPFMPPKLVIPVIAADSVYFNDDNKAFEDHTKYAETENNEQYDSLERKIPKQRRFSLDYGAQSNKKEIISLQNNNITRDRLTRSWRDLKNAPNDVGAAAKTITFNYDSKKKCNTNDVYINSLEPIYNNIDNPGPLTIEVRGSPVESFIKINDDFDPDTLDRKPKKTVGEIESKRRVEKIVLKSGGSFKNKLRLTAETQQDRSPPEDAFTRKIGSLRQIYEARTKDQNNVGRLYERRGSVPYGTQELAAYVKKLEQPKNLECEFELKPPIPPKQKRSTELYSRNNTPKTSPPSDRYRSSEERDKFPPYSKSDNLNARRSGRRSARTRPRRVDIRKLCRTEDSGYLSTDSNDSKRKARYLMQLKPKFVPPEPVLKPPASKVNNLHIDTDTDDLESLCDGRSESGGESVETDSVFFGSFNDSKHIFEELGYGPRHKLGRHQEQIDSGFAGETNIILSGDSDSEHKSVISIVTGRDGRASAASISNLDDSPYVQSVEC